MWKTTFLFAALVGLLGCGHGEGDTCNNDNDCAQGLTCQPIPGRNADYCCGIPASASTADTCHAAASQ